MQRKLTLKLLVLTLTAMLSLGLAAGASAAVIDFANGTYADLNDGGAIKSWSSLSYSDGITSVHAQVGNLKFTVTGWTGGWTTYGSAWMGNNDGVLGWDEWRAGSGGLGVGPKDPSAIEVSAAEGIQILFDEPVFLTTLDLSLFYSEDGYQEDAWWFGPNGWNYMVADANIRLNDGGYNWLGLYNEDLGGVFTNFLFLTAGYGVNTPDDATVEFKLSKLSVEGPEPDPDVPEPGTMLLLGSAAGALGILRRRLGHK